MNKTKIPTQKELLDKQRQAKLKEWNKKYPQGIFGIQNWDGNYPANKKGNIEGKCYLCLSHTKKPATSCSRPAGVTIYCYRNDKDEIKIVRNFWRNNSFGCCKYFANLKDIKMYAIKEMFPSKMIRVFEENCELYFKNPSDYISMLRDEYNNLCKQRL